MDTRDTAKAGWLYRRSTVLNRWKKYWFVLRTNGDLLYFENQLVPRAEERIVVRAQVARVKPGSECNDANPPEGKSKGCLLGLEMVNRSLVVLCAESTDDMRAWQIALDEARVMNATVPPPVVRNVQTVYTGPGYPYATTSYSHQMSSAYPGQVISYPGQQVVYDNPANTTYVVNGNGGNPNVVYINNRRRYNYGNAGAGFMAGAALGTMMWWPYMW